MKDFLIVRQSTPGLHGSVCTVVASPLSVNSVIHSYIDLNSANRHSWLPICSVHRFFRSVVLVTHRLGAFLTRFQVSDAQIVETLAIFFRPTHCVNRRLITIIKDYRASEALRSLYNLCYNHLRHLGKKNSDMGRWSDQLPNDWSLQVLRCNYELRVFLTSLNDNFQPSTSFLPLIHAGLVVLQKNVLGLHVLTTEITKQ